jgi:hypothetical protein
MADARLSKTGPWVRLALAVLPIACALSVPPVATAASPTSANHIDGVRLDVHADVGGYASLGAGFRVDIPLVGSGLIVGVDDELALSPGLDMFFLNIYRNYYDGAPYAIPNCVLQWNFYLGPVWSLFPEAGVAFYVGDGQSLPRGLPLYAALDVGLGARYHFSRRNALLARLSTPSGLQLGVTF